jgi:RNA polymerase sigma-70 factor, ECF subfamily
MNKQDEFVRYLSRESSRIFGFILALAVNRNDADDVFQETSVVLWRRFDEFEPGTNFRAWACRIAQLQVMNFRRSHNRCRVLSDDALQALAQNALAVMDRDDRREETLATCLEKLRPQDRQLIEQRYFRRHTTKEIAEREARSIHSVYRALRRVHELLLRCVRQGLALESN